MKANNFVLKTVVVEGVVAGIVVVSKVVVCVVISVVVASVEVVNSVVVTSGMPVLVDNEIGCITILSIAIASSISRPQ